MPDRPFLSIGEVLALLKDEFPDITISKIRFLESQGLLDPERTASGYRKFYEPDIDRLRWILRQQRENFLPLKVIKVRLQGGEEVEMDGSDTEPGMQAGIAGEGGQPKAGEEPAAAAPMATVMSTSTAAQPDESVQGPADDDPVPIWMSDIARQSGRQPVAPAEGETRPASATGHAAPSAVTPVQATEPGEEKSVRPGGGPERRIATPLDSGPSTVSLTAEELAKAADIHIDVVRELEKFGLLAGRPIGSDRFYDADALVVAQKSAVFLARGLEPRHLRMFKVAVEREAGILEQVVMPMLKQRNPAARQQAVDALGELSLLGQQLRNALLRTALRDHLQPP